MLSKELKIFALGVLAASIGALFVFSNLSIIPSTTSVSGNEDTAFLTYHAKVCKAVTRADGTVEDLGCSKNMFNTDGMNFTRDLMSAVDGNGTAASLRFIAVGNKTMTQSVGIQCIANQYPTNTFLCGEYNTCGLDRGPADAIRLNSTASAGGNNVTAGNWTITREFTSTQNGCDVNSTGLFNTTTVNQSNEVFFAQNTFTTATLQNNDKINVTWFIWVT